GSIAETQPRAAASTGPPGDGGAGSGRLSHRLVDVSTDRRPHPSSVQSRLPSGSRRATAPRVWLQPPAAPAPRQGARRSAGARLGPAWLSPGKKNPAALAPLYISLLNSIVACA